jgi:hypothetical protein
MKTKTFLLILLFGALFSLQSFIEKNDSETIKPFNLSQVTISGTVSVLDAPLLWPGADVYITGTSYGVQTDINGYYFITASVGDVIEFSVIGFITVSVTVEENINTINVVLPGDFSND